MENEEINIKIDEFEKQLMSSNLDLIDCPLTHRFVPGMYIREIFMPKGAIVTSLIHKTNHPYFVLKGEVAVYSENDGVQHIKAPFIGITKPDTRRVLHIVEDCVWATVHKTDIQPEDDSDEAIEKAVNMIGDEIIEKRENTFLGCMIKNNKTVQLIND